MNQMMPSEQYAADERNVCPACHCEHEIDGKAVDFGGPTAHQEVLCLACSSGWTDDYRRTGYVIHAKGEGIGTPALSNEEYAASEEGDQCPLCGISHGIEGDEPTVDGRILTVECYCGTCESEWQDTYERTGYSNMDATPLVEHVAFLQVSAPLRASRKALMQAILSLIEVGQQDAVDTLAEDKDDADEQMRVGALIEVDTATVLRMATDAEQACHVVVLPVKAPQGVAPEVLSAAVRRLIDIGQTDASETLGDSEWHAPSETKLAASLEFGPLAVSLKEAA